MASLKFGVYHTHLVPLGLHFVVVQVLSQCVTSRQGQVGTWVVTEEVGSRGRPYPLLSPSSDTGSVWSLAVVPGRGLQGGGCASAV